MTLQQHLGDPGGLSEISVNLEWGMGIEQVRVNAACVVHDRSTAARGIRKDCRARPASNSFLR